MSELLEGLKLWIESIITTLGYPGIALIMAIENIFPPIPSEVVLPFAGFLVADGRYSFIGVVLAGMIGSVVGALVLYYFGLWSNEAIIRRFIRRFGKFLLVSEADLDTALNYFSRYGEAVIFFGRLIPLVRSLISIPAGMQRMPLPKFLFYTSIGTALWSAILTYAGMILGQNWETVLGYIEQYQRVVVVAIGLAVLAFIYFRVIRPRFQRPSTAR
jgi:membrane protein DedA with SNARE-associated domain